MFHKNLTAGSIFQWNDLKTLANLYRNNTRLQNLRRFKSKSSEKAGCACNKMCYNWIYTAPWQSRIQGINLDFFLRLTLLIVLLNGATKRSWNWSFINQTSWAKKIEPLTYTLKAAWIVIRQLYFIISLTKDR